MSFGVERKLAKRLVSFQEPVQRLELTEIVSRQGPSLVIADETSEPLAQRPRLVRQLVEFARTSLRPKRSQGVVRDKPGLVQPVQESIAIVDPVNHGIDRRGDRVQEIQAGQVGNENSSGAAIHLGFLDAAAALPNHRCNNRLQHS